MVDYCNPSMAVASPSFAGGEKKHWWLTNKKMVERYVREAKMLIATQEQSEIAAALGLLEAALALAPRMEVALELKARCLLHLRRFKEVADMLQDYIPSLRMAASDDTSSCGSSDNSSSQLSRERVKLLSSGGDSLSGDEPAFKCFSVSDLKKKVMAGLCKNVEKEGQWRYSVLGQACCHLGLMEEAMVLLQTGKRLATAAFRRESISLSDDIFSFNKFPNSGENLINNQPQTPPKTESESISHLLCHIKLLIRRKTAAIAALDAGLYSEAIRHFSKILDGRRGAPQGFLSECYVHRASAFRSAGRLAEAIADCNRALALETSCIDALTIRANLFESIRCLPDSLHDLEHLKLLYNSILRDRKLPGPVWKRQSVQYREIPGKLCSLASKMQQLKQRVAAGETGNVDYYALIGLRRGCSRSELERAHLLLTLKHKPDKSSSFIERCEFADEKEVDSVRDRAKMSCLLLYRLIQRGYTSVMSTILDEEAAEKQRKKAAAAVVVHQQQLPPSGDKVMQVAAANNNNNNNKMENKATAIIKTPPPSVFQGVFCRDLTVVGNLLSQAGFNRPIPVKYEALSC
ncbi:Heat shock protein DnaJ with tetratricopeptide repeat-containing protein [Perilla frutescens var. hirtella]|uniref:Heat shock protein DnaJ with tetratricopeptide repeat-containing protein n=1 Tax=Perilla frutescens var. hirtella TaxID=608512 RepID=A0AAD4IYP3_PERFH|nr:Heat shock protein DnaJ with tetratricopeptide repeat-containing protein [Perilla frutescens var. hirtella]